MASAPDMYLEELDPLNAISATTIIYAASDPNNESYQLPVSILFTSPSFQGNPTAPTQPGTDSSNRIATTAFVKGQMTGVVHTMGDETISGNKTFTTSVKSSVYYLTGPSSSYTVNRRNDGGNAWQVFSQTGELSFWDYTSGSTVVSISPSNTTANHMFSINSQTTIAGPLYIGNSLNITINQSSLIGWRLAGDGVGNMYFQATNNGWNNASLVWKTDAVGNLTLSPLPVSLGSVMAGAQFRSLGARGNSHWLEFTDGASYYDSYSGHTFRNTSGVNAAFMSPGSTVIYGPGLDAILDVRGVVNTSGGGAADLILSNASVTTGTLRLAGIQGMTGTSLNTGKLNFLVKKAAADISLTPVAYFDESGSFVTNGDVTVGGNLTIVGTVNGEGTGGTPGGVTGDIQFNNMGAFAGFGNWNGTTLTVNAFAGAGSGLTGLNASNLASGTVPIARLGASGTPNTSTFLRGDNSWSTVPIGSVTSVGIAVPAGFGVSNTPITSAGVITITTSLSGVIKGTGSGFTTDSSLTAISGFSPTKGTLIVGNGSTWVAVGAGTNDQVLTADSTQVAGVKWGVGAAYSYAVTIGDGTSTSFTVTHGLATQDIDVIVRSANAPFDVQVISWQATTLNTVTVGPFDTPPIAGQYRVVVLSHGGAGSTTTGTGSGTVTNVSVVSANGFAGTVNDPTGAPAITLTTSVIGVVKGNGTAFLAAVAGTDYLIPTGSGSGLTNLNASNLSSGTVPIARIGTGVPSASNFLRGDYTWAIPSVGGTGTVTSVALAVPAGFSVSGSPVTTAGTLTITTNLSSMIKGTGTGFTNAVAGIDYLTPTGNGSQLIGITGSQISGNISGNAAGITGTIPSSQISGSIPGSQISGDIPGNAASINGNISGAQVSGNILGNAASITGTISGSQVNGNISGNAVSITGTISSFQVTGTIPGSQVSGNIPGNAVSITGSITEGQVTGLSADLASKATDTNVVHLTGNETIGGTKTFTNMITGNISGNASSITGSITEGQVTNLTTDLSNKQPLSATLTSLAGATYVTGKLLGGQGTGVPTTVTVGSGLSLVSNTLTATAVTTSPGGATGDMQWNNAGMFTGGGPTWDGSGLFTVVGQILMSSASVSPAAGAAIITINNRTTGQGASIYFSDAGNAQFVLGSNVPGGIFLRDMAASVNVLTCAPNGSIALVGTPTAPTAAAKTNTNQIATTAFVEREIAGITTGGATPAGSTGDLQWNNGGVLAGGGPSWNGSNLFTVAGFIRSAGHSSGFFVQNQSTGTDAWTIYSGSGNFQLQNNLGVDRFWFDPLGNLTISSTLVTGSGTTRPTTPSLGAQWYDPSIPGPIWWNGSAWQAPGSTVITGSNYSWVLAAGTPAITGADITNWLMVNRAITIFAISICAKLPPTGASFIIDILFSTDGITWTSIWTTTANRLTLPAGVKIASTTTFNTASIAAGSILRLDIIQIGSTFAGQNITVQLST